MTRYLRIAEVVRRTGVSRSTIYELMGKGEFPLARRLTSRTVGWAEAEIDDWMATRETAPIKPGSHRGRRVVRVARSGNARAGGETR